MVLPHSSSEAVIYVSSTLSTNNFANVEKSSGVAFLIIIYNPFEE